jgi:hypothetical protein
MQSALRAHALARDRRAGQRVGPRYHNVVGWIQTNCDLASRERHNVFLYVSFLADAPIA